MAAQKLDDDLVIIQLKYNSEMSVIQERSFESSVPGVEVRYERFIQEICEPNNHHEGKENRLLKLGDIHPTQRAQDALAKRKMMEKMHGDNSMIELREEMLGKYATIR